MSYTLYEFDFYSWAHQQSDLLRQGQFDQAETDLPDENVPEICPFILEEIINQDFCPEPKN